MMIFGLDPGMDETGLAVFDYSAFLDGGATPQAGLLALIHHSTISTHPSSPLGHRVTLLSNALLEAAETYRPNWAVVEIPSTPGDYARKEATRRSLQLLHIAVGACLASMASAPLCLVHAEHASKMPKSQRHADLRMVWERTFNSRPWPAGPRGGQREDELDAIHLGWWAMLGGTCHNRWKALATTPEERP